MTQFFKPGDLRLRTSCDGCFFAKVKCSKRKPICSRCIVHGIDCHYSPSKRMGKHKPDGCINANTQQKGNSADSRIHFPTPKSEDHKSAQQYITPDLQSLEHICAIPEEEADTFIESHQKKSGAAMLPVKMPLPRSEGTDDIAGLEISGKSWISTPNTPNQLSEHRQCNSPVFQCDLYFQPAESPITTLLPTCKGYIPHSVLPCGGSQATDSRGAVSSSAAGTPSHLPFPDHQSSADIAQMIDAPCICFTDCINSLLNLENISTAGSPPFDLVLSLNHAAVERCISILTCKRCLSRFSGYTVAMLLATVIGKIALCYNNAFLTYFKTPGCAPGGPSMLGVSLGAYQLCGNDNIWLELEILGCELRQLRNTYNRFEIACPELLNNPEFSGSLMRYIGELLNSTTEVLDRIKDNVSGLWGS